MTATRCPAPIGFADVVDYWAGDLTRAEEDRIEEHMFTCADCAREVAAAEGSLAVSRPRRARGGCIRSSPIRFSIVSPLTACGSACSRSKGSGIVPCAVWADDDLVVARIRADLAGVDSVTIVTRQASGAEISRLPTSQCGPVSMRS